MRRSDDEGCFRIGLLVHGGPSVATRKRFSKTNVFERKNAPAIIRNRKSIGVHRTVFNEPKLARKVESLSTLDAAKAISSGTGAAQV